MSEILLTYGPWLHRGSLTGLGSTAAMISLAVAIPASTLVHQRAGASQQLARLMVLG